MTWLYKLRLRVLAIALGLALAAVGLLSIWTLPAWPVFGVTFAVVAVAVNTLGARLSKPTCLNCGHDLSDAPASAYGVTCQSCGQIQASTYARVALLPPHTDEQTDEQTDDQDDDSADTDADQAQA